MKIRPIVCRLFRRLGWIQARHRPRVTCPRCGKDYAQTKGGVWHHHCDQKLPEMGPEAN